jgi:hypothetical protein
VLLLASARDRQRVLAPRACSLASLVERAHEATRGLRRADRRAELHQSLVELTRCVLGGQCRHQLASTLPQCALARRRLDIELEAEDAREHTSDISVDERCPLLECDRCDRAGGVGSDAGNLAQLARSDRQRAAPRIRNLSCAVPQVARARVIPEACPHGEHVVERGRGERLDRRKPRHPAFPVRDHGLHAGLLQHDLADPDRIRIARTAPRQVTPGAAVMRDDRAGDRLKSHPRSLPQGQGSRSARRPARRSIDLSCTGGSS